MSALEKQLRQLCMYQDDVAVGIQDHDEYMMRRAIRLRENLVEKILRKYEPEKPSLMLVPVRQRTGQDAR